MQAAPWMHPDAEFKEAREVPGPGQYDLSQHSDFGLAPQMQTLQVRKTERPLQMPLRVSQMQPQQTSKKLLMSKSHIRLARITMKGMRTQEEKDHRHQSPTQFDKWPKSTFGAGRTPVDSWGRGAEPRIPGPGTYDAALEGTFEAKRRTTEDLTVFAESAHLKSTERRLENLRHLQVKYRRGILDTAEKGIYERESRPSTVERLQRRKEHFQGLLGSKSKCFDDMFRPRSSYVLPCQAISSRRSRRSPKSPRGLEPPAYDLPPRPKTMQSLSTSTRFTPDTSLADEPYGSYPALLSNYEFATASLPASEAYGFGLLDCESSSGTNPVAFGASRLGAGQDFDVDDGDDYDDGEDDERAAAGRLRSSKSAIGRGLGCAGLAPRSLKANQELPSPVPAHDMSLARYPPSRNQEDDHIPSDVELDSDDDNDYLEAGLASPAPAYRGVCRPRSVPTPSFWTSLDVAKRVSKR